MIPHVLVIDPNEDLTDNIRELLEGTGVRVSTLLDQRGVEELAAEDPFDLVLVDVRLRPVRAGTSLLSRLRDVSPEGEAIVMTGSATVHSAMEAVRHGVFAYLSKPFDPDDLLRLVERALGQVALRRERTLLSRELARSEALHRAVFDSVGSLIVGIDPRGTIRLWNQSAARTTGLPSSAALGRDVGEVLLPPERRPALQRMIEEATKGGQRTARLPLQTRSHDERVIDWHVRPLALDSVGEPMVLLAGTDLTERLEAERRAASAEAMAAMGHLTSSLAHEIRNPLNAATLQLELLRRSAAKAQHDSIERRARVVAEELDRLTSLLNDFLGLARPKQFAMGGVDPARVARTVYELHEPKARELGVRLTVDVRGEIPEVYADEGRVKQALINLIMNALDATAADPHAAGPSAPQVDARAPAVELRVEVRGEFIELTVRDNGPGIPKGQRVLEPFETTKEGGTGLGLPIVKRIAEMHGGALTLSPCEDGRGTRAAITLPLRGGTNTVRETG